MKNKFKSLYFDCKNLLFESINPFFKERFKDKDFINDLVSLKKNGVLIKDSFFDTNVIDEINSYLDDNIKNSEFTKYNEVDGKSYNCVNSQPFTLHYNFINFATNDFLVNLVKSYFRRNKIYLSDSSYEILPPSEINEGSYKWHFDLRGLQIKAMVLLTDVDINGQYFTYIKGSHCFRSSLKDNNSRFSNDYISKKFDKKEIVNCFSKKGSLIIFDSRGLHKGTRQNTYERKNITINFKPNKFFKQKMIINEKYKRNFDDLGILV